jgi:hypothetical protein
MGISIVREINPHSSKKHKYVLIATNYFTKWVEVVSLTHMDEKVIICFLKENSIMKFGIHLVIMFDNASCFSSSLLLA